MRRVAYVLLLVVGIVAASYDDETVHSEKSGTSDDDTIFAYCNAGYVVARCKCKPHGDCDGATIQMNKHGEACVAHNKGGGNGVVAEALCRKFAITVDSEMGNRPSASCPSGYRLASCALHSTVRDELENFEIKTGGHTCNTAKGCTTCAVQARCVVKHQHEDVYHPHS